jgi:hypothetical protein
MTFRSWFAVEGALEPIDYAGPSFFRFPEAVAQHVIERYSRPGDWVLDPFCGFGTTLVVAERLGRQPLGFEVDAGRAAFAASRIANAQHVIHTRAEDVAADPWPPCALLLTSPPYGSFRTGEYDNDPATYLADARRLFSGLMQFLTADATLAVEISQVREGDRTRPLVWQLGSVLSEFLVLQEDLVRINTASAEAGPGYDHSHVLVFRPRREPS